MANVIAYWTIELNCHCPECTEYVDLLEYEDFWDKRPLDIGEHCTDRSRDIAVVCPYCGHEFNVECQY